MRNETGQIIRLKDYQPTDFIIDKVAMTIRLRPEKTIVRSSLSCRRRDGANPDVPLKLDGEGLTLRSIKLDGAPLALEREDSSPNHLTVRNLPEKSGFVLTTETEIAPDGNRELMGLYRTNGLYCSQCEAEGFRRITYFLDRPDVLATYTVRLEAMESEAPLLLANGNRIDEGPMDDGMHYAVWSDPFPKPCYLFAVVAGDLGCLEDEFVTMGGRRVTLRIFVEHGNESRAEYAMDALKRCMRWDEEKFGREYDLDIFMVVAVSHFNMGAMENKGLNIFNDRFVLANSETATDKDYAHIEAIIAHEYFHNWTGNRITCRDWFQLCLKEGLTVFRDHEFSADQRSAVVERIQQVRTLRARQFPEDAGPLAHPVRPESYREINNFYTATVYEKGAEIVRMLRIVLGGDDFHDGLDLYFARHDGEAATIEQFLACFADASGRNLRQFKDWYVQAGTPQLAISSIHDEEAATLTVRVAQSIPSMEKDANVKNLHIPLAYGLIGPDGEDMTPHDVTGGECRSSVMHVTEQSQSFVFSGVAQKPVLSLLRGFSAPVTLAFDRTFQDCAFLALHDSDLFSRWQNFHDMALQIIVAGSQEDISLTPPDHNDLFLKTAIGIVSRSDLEPAFRAQILDLPSEADAAQAIGGDIEPDSIHHSRQQLLDRLAQAGQDTFNELYRLFKDEGRYRPDAESAGRRALCLGALAYSSRAAGEAKQAQTHFQTSTNMTDVSGALSILVQQFSGTEETHQALDEFEKRYGHDPLILDKWFAVQAGAPGKDTLDRVRLLEKHPSFSLSNPNRVRALIGAFAASNPTGFHRADGASYAYLADRIGEIDAINPQVAARLATAFGTWKSMEPVRREKANQTLEFLSRLKGASTDLKDIVERSLAGSESQD